MKDDLNAGRLVRKGSSFYVSALYLHTNPALWEEPYEYQPETWTVVHDDSRDILDYRTDPEDQRRRPTPRPKGQHPRRFMPFGSGIHQCQARWYACDEMIAVLRVIVDQFDLEIVDDRGLFDLPYARRMAPHVYTRPVRDIRVRAHKRTL